MGKRAVGNRQIFAFYVAVVKFCLRKAVLFGAEIGKLTEFGLKFKSGNGVLRKTMRQTERNSAGAGADI